MEYNLKLHGDLLEKEFSDFISSNLNTYEAVWKLYIGNKGNDTKADINYYSSDRDLKRQEFSEHTYTILQSIVLLKRLVENDIFKKGHLNNLEEVLNLQDCLLLFFAHLGRIRDNVEKASTCLVNSETKKVTNILEEFYYKRHIIVHGKTIPILYRQNGEIFIPVLSKNGTDVSGWNHKIHNWQDGFDMKVENLTTTVNQLFWELLPKLVAIFGEFKNKIEDELNLKNLVLKFEYNLYQHKSITPNNSSAGLGAVNVYGLAQSTFNTNSSSSLKQ